MACAVRTGRVLFSTTILSPPDAPRMVRAVFSQYSRFGAFPAPSPKVLVGVFTETKITSAPPIAAGMSVEKKRLRPRACFTTSSSPGS